MHRHGTISLGSHHLWDMTAQIMGLKFHNSIHINYNGELPKLCNTKDLNWDQ